MKQLEQLMETVKITMKQERLHLRKKRKKRINEVDLKDHDVTYLHRFWT